MTKRAETAEAVTELLPPCVYPVWSPYDAYEAALLLAALAGEHPCFMEEKNENSTR